MNLKVGDTPTVKKDLVVGKGYGCQEFIKDMADMRGKKVTISTKDGTNYKIEEFGWSWTDEMFESPAEDTTVGEVVKLANRYFRHKTGLTGCGGYVCTECIFRPGKACNKHDILFATKALIKWNEKNPPKTNMDVFKKKFSETKTAEEFLEVDGSIRSGFMKSSPKTYVEWLEQEAD